MWHWICNKYISTMLIEAVYKKDYYKPESLIFFKVFFALLQTFMEYLRNVDV